MFHEIRIISEIDQQFDALMLLKIEDNYFYISFVLDK
jgi:hypothetical protein